MNLITLDFESYYDQEFSLSKLTTEEYIRSPEFEAIGLSIKQNDMPTKWYIQPQIEEALAQIDWSNAAVLAQNMAFDGAILHWRYGVKPKMWLDTLSMSRALYPHEKSHSLAAQAQRAGLEAKGDEVHRAKGKRYKDFTPEELISYGVYCAHDTNLAYQLFSLYAPKFPKLEIKLIDLTLRMFIEPVLELDKARLVKHLEDVKERKQALLDTVRDQMLKDMQPDFVHMIFSEGTAGIKKLLMSNEKFAEALRLLDVEPPQGKPDHRPDGLRVCQDGRGHERPGGAPRHAGAGTGGGASGQQDHPGGDAH
jgi:DNA polymerase III epsilon subunit-like protein